MAESVKVLPKEIQALIDVHQWDMRTPEGVQRFRELKARSLPSVALDNELVYEAIIPGQEALSEEIRHRYVHKTGKASESVSEDKRPNQRGSDG